MQKNQRTIYCTNCGHKHLPTDNFCQMCGTSVVPKKTSVGTMIKNDLMESVSERRQRNPEIRWFAFFVLIMVFVLLFLITR